MKARLGWALLLLAAVFVLHGLQCMAAEPAVGPAAHGAVAMDMAAHPAHAVAASALPADAGSTGTSDAPAGHESGMHALMACLAVLAGGFGVAMAALAAWLARRRARALTRQAAGAARAAVDRRRPWSSAPELARLCVLRI